MRAPRAPLDGGLTCGRNVAAYYTHRRLCAASNQRKQFPAEAGGCGRSAVELRQNVVLFGALRSAKRPTARVMPAIPAGTSPRRQNAVSAHQVVPVVEYAKPTRSLPHLVSHLVIA